MDNKAQISIEMILIMAALFAIALFVLQNLIGNADKFAGKMNESRDELLAEIDKITGKGVE